MRYAQSTIDGSLRDTIGKVFFVFFVSFVPFVFLPVTLTQMLTLRSEAGSRAA